MKNFSFLKMALYGLSILLAMALQFSACQKEAVMQSNLSSQTENAFALAAVVPYSGYSEYFAESKGCALYKRDVKVLGQTTNTFYLQTIDFSKGAYITPTTTLPSNFPSNENNRTPNFSRKKVREYYDAFNTKLFSVTNATFFDYSDAKSNEKDSEKCARTTTSAFPIKSEDFILTCGSPSNSNATVHKKKVFFIKKNKTTGVLTPGVSTYGGISWDDFKLSTTQTLNSSYYSSVVGLAPSSTLSSVTDLLGTGRTFLGVKGSKVFIMTATSRSKNEMISELQTIMGDTGDTNIIMFDGSESTQLTCKGSDIIKKDRCVPSVFKAYYGS